MTSKVLHSLAVEIPKLYREQNETGRTRTRFLNILPRDYRPEEMSDAENQIVWTGIVLFSLKSGLTVTDYLNHLGITAMEFQQWTNGVSMPQGSTKKKNLCRQITELVKIKRSTG